MGIDEGLTASQTPSKSRKAELFLLTERWRGELGGTEDLSTIAIL